MFAIKSFLITGDATTIQNLVEYTHFRLYGPLKLSSVSVDLNKQLKKQGSKETRKQGRRKHRKREGRNKGRIEGKN